MERNGKRRMAWLSLMAMLVLVLAACKSGGGEGEGSGTASGVTAGGGGGGGAPVATGGDPFTLTAGFAAMSMTGRSGGTNDASSHGPDCVGNIAGSADHAMTVTGGPVTALITATSEADTTLVILGPGGPYCNDDHDGLNPGIQGTFPAGEYQVFVGNYSSDEGATAYTLNVAPATAEPEGDPMMPPGEMPPGMVPTTAPTGVVPPAGTPPVAPASAPTGP